MSTTEPTSILPLKISKQKRYCLCCGKSFEVEHYIVQDFCNRCFPIVAKETFKKENGNLTCKELIKKIKRIMETKS